MDKIKEQLVGFYNQIRDLFLSMTPGNRIIASLLMLTLLISLGYLIVGSIKRTDPQSNYVRIYNGRSFNYREARAIEDALSKAGLKAHQWRGEQLEVPRSVAAQYTAVIAEAKAITDAGNAQKETADNLSPWDSNLSKTEKMFQAKAKDVAATIEKLPGIASAEVLPNRRLEWDRNVWARRSIVSCAVNIEAIYNKPLDHNTITSICGLVASAFGITDPKEISIIDGQNSRIYNGSGKETGGGGGDYLREQRRYQEEWRDKIYSMLPHIQGLQVETTVILKDLINEKIFTVQHEKPKAPLHEHVRGTDYRSENASRYGRPGQEAQMSRPLIDPTRGVAEKAIITDKTHEREITNALHGTEKNAEVIPYVPEKIFASLQIPREHVLKTWVAKNRTKEDPNPEPTAEQLEEESERIRMDTRQLIAKLLEEYRSPKSPDPLDMVEVKIYDPYRELVEPLTAWEQFVQWLQTNWQTLGLMGIVLCGLCVLWALTRPVKPEPIVIYEAPEIPMDVIEAHARARAEAEAAAAAEEEEDLPRSLDGFDGNIRSLQEEIGELVEENPEAAAAVLRQWIGKVVPTDVK